MGGAQLFVLNNYSLPQVLSIVYPDYNWTLTKFRSSTKGNSENWKELMDYFAKELNIKEMNDWYKIKAEVVTKGGCYSNILNSK